MSFNRNASSFSITDIKSLRSALRERDMESAAKWYFALSGLTEDQLMASGVFTCDLRHVFYSRRAIASFRGKLLGLRDSCTPGRRITAVQLQPYGQAEAVMLSLENLEKEFRERVPFFKKKMYFVVLISGPAAAANESVENMEH